MENVRCNWRVPDAVQRSSRCSAEPGPMLMISVGPGSAAQRYTLRCVRGTRACYSAACRWARASRTSASSSTVSIGVKSRCAMYSGRVGVRM